MFCKFVDKHIFFVFYNALELHMVIRIIFVRISNAVDQIENGRYGSLQPHKMFIRNDEPNIARLINVAFAFVNA